MIYYNDNYMIYMIIVIATFIINNIVVIFK